MPVKIAVLKETRAERAARRHGARRGRQAGQARRRDHMQSGAGDAVKLPDSRVQERRRSPPMRSELVRDADVVVSRAAARACSRRGDEGRRDPDFVRLRAQGSRS